MCRFFLLGGALHRRRVHVSRFSTRQMRRRSVCFYDSRLSQHGRLHGSLRMSLSSFSPISRSMFRWLLRPLLSVLSPRQLRSPRYRARSPHPAHHLLERRVSRRGDLSSPSFLSSRLPRSLSRRHLSEVRRSLLGSAGLDDELSFRHDALSHGRVRGVVSWSEWMRRE